MYKPTSKTLTPARDLKDVLSRAWKSLNVNGFYVLLLVFVFTLPINVGLEWFWREGAMVLPVNEEQWFAIWWMAALVVFFWNVWVLTATVMIAGESKGKAIKSFGAILKKAWGKILPVAGTGLLLAVLVVIASLFLILPGFVYGVFWLFALPIAVFEKHVGWPAMVKSYDFVEDNWTHVAGAFISFVLLTFLPLLSIIWLVDVFFPGYFWVNLITQFSCGILGTTIYLFMLTELYHSYTDGKWSSR